jgi:hypothetical protein
VNSIYVVTQCWQDYGDGGATPIFATADISKAEAKVEEMKACQILRNSVYDSIQAHMKHWEVDHPRPQPVLDKKKNKKNEPVQLNELFRDWAAMRYAEMVSFTATFTQAEQDAYRELTPDLFWEIETVPFVE